MAAKDRKSSREQIRAVDPPLSNSIAARKDQHLDIVLQGLGRQNEVTTGFDYDAPDDVPETAAPDAATLALLRRQVRQELAESYPQFAASLPAWRDAA